MKIPRFSFIDRLKLKYLGQTKVAESDLQTFLDAAEELKVLGLTDTSGFKRDLGLGGTKPVKVTQSDTEPAHLTGSNVYLNPGTATGKPAIKQSGTLSLVENHRDTVL